MSVISPTRTGDPIHKAASAGFGTAESTAAYEKARPSYPPSAVDSLLVHALSRTFPASRPSSPTPQQVNVLDVGAGTGIFTRLLHSRLLHYSQHVDSTIKFSLTAVEPVEGMRTKFIEVTDPSIPIIAGSGSDLSSIPDSSIAVITCAQAFHWMSTPATLNEFRRVLLPGGCLLLIWNTRDRRVKWVDDLEALIDSYYTPDVPRQQTGEFKRVFERPEVEGRWSGLEGEVMDDGVIQRGDVDMMWVRVSSISVVSRLGKEEKVEAERRVKEIILNHEENKGKTEFELPYVTEMYWSFKEE